MARPLILTSCFETVNTKFCNIEQLNAEQVDEKEAQMTQLPPKDRSPINSVDKGSKPKV